MKARPVPVALPLRPSAFNFHPSSTSRPFRGGLWHAVSARPELETAGGGSPLNVGGNDSWMK